MNDQDRGAQSTTTVNTRQLATAVRSDHVRGLDMLRMAFATLDGDEAVADVARVTAAFGCLADAIQEQARQMLAVLDGAPDRLNRQTNQGLGAGAAGMFQESLLNAAGVPQTAIRARRELLGAHGGVPPAGQPLDGGPPDGNVVEGAQIGGADLRRARVTAATFREPEVLEFRDERRERRGRARPPPTDEAVAAAAALDAGAGMLAGGQAVPDPFYFFPNTGESFNTASLHLLEPAMPTRTALPGTKSGANSKALTKLCEQQAPCAQLLRALTALGVSCIGQVQRGCTVTFDMAAFGRRGSALSELYNRLVGDEAAGDEAGGGGGGSGAAAHAPAALLTVVAALQRLANAAAMAVRHAPQLTMAEWPDGAAAIQTVYTAITSAAALDDADYCGGDSMQRLVVAGGQMRKRSRSRRAPPPAAGPVVLLSSLSELAVATPGGGGGGGGGGGSSGGGGGGSSGGGGRSNSRGVLDFRATFPGGNPYRTAVKLPLGGARGRDSDFADAEEGVGASACAQELDFAEEAPTPPLGLQASLEEERAELLGAMHESELSNFSHAYGEVTPVAALHFSRRHEAESAALLSAGQQDLGGTGASSSASGGGGGGGGGELAACPQWFRDLEGARRFALSSGQEGGVLAALDAVAVRVPAGPRREEMRGLLLAWATEQETLGMRSAAQRATMMLTGWIDAD
jgi:hypothetical protein